MVDRKWWHAAVDFLLPPHCLLCGSPSGHSCLCKACHAELPRLTRQCRRCGLPLSSVVDETCGQCIRKTPPFTCTLAALEYRFPADRLVQAFKFKRQLLAGRILSQAICERAGLTGFERPDAFIPVPLHRRRLSRRGFNQAYELGVDISRNFDIPLKATALRRRRNTKAQSGLNRKQRRRNLKEAFYWATDAKPPRHVALVDDVMTTGTTVAECARVLMAAGANRVDVWVAARASHAKRK